MSGWLPLAGTSVGGHLRRLVLYAALAVAVYAGARHNPFHYDDLHSVLYNPHIRSLHSVPAFFADPASFSGRAEGFMYRPVLLVTYAANYAAGGQQVAGYRWVNLSFHVLAAAALWGLAVQLGLAPRAASAAGLVFLLHPLHAEPINYISARSDLLVSLLYLVALVLGLHGTAEAGADGGRAPARGTVRRQGLWRAAAVAAYAAALLTKSVAVTLPVALLLAQGLRSGLREITRYWRYHIVLLFVTLAYLWVIWDNRFLVGAAARAPRPLAAQLLTQTKALVYYLFLAVMPVKLTVEHAFAVSTRLGEPAVLAAGACGISGLALVWFAGARWLRASVLLAGLVLAPASLVPLNILVSERRAYLALLGLALVLGVLWARVRRQLPPRVGGAAAAALLVVWAGLAMQRNQVWASGVRLWEEAVARGPGMYRSRLNLGLAYEREGRLAAAQEQLQEGLRLHPAQAEAWVVLGNVLRRQGQADAAEAAYRRALEHNPRLAGAYHNLGNIELVERGNVDRAVAHYQRCLALDPHLVQARTNLGQAYERLGRPAAARTQYEMAVRDSHHWAFSRDPELGGTWLNLAVLLEAGGDTTAAAAAYARAVQILGAAPAYAEYARQAAVGLARTGGAAP